MQALKRSVRNLLEGSAAIVNSFTQVRFRYYDPNKFKFRRWGYDDKLKWEGPMPRTASSTRMPMPEYRPKNSWSGAKSLFGQNDYIDILGDPKMHPVLISYNVPPWLRGFKGNEFQTLLRKRNLMGSRMKAMAPDSYHSLKKQIKYQYSFLRYNKPQNYLPKGYTRE